VGKVQRLRSSGLGIKACRLRDELLAPLGAAPGENEAATFSGHARTESVRALAAQLAGLISAFHGRGSAKKAGKAKP
jgi:hypothetical protein